MSRYPLLKYQERVGSIIDNIVVREMLCNAAVRDCGQAQDWVCATQEERTSISLICWPVSWKTHFRFLQLQTICTSCRVIVSVKQSWQEDICVRCWGGGALVSGVICPDFRFLWHSCLHLTQPLFVEQSCLIWKQGTWLPCFSKVMGSYRTQGWTSEKGTSQPHSYGDAAPYGAGYLGTMLVLQRFNLWNHRIITVGEKHYDHLVKPSTHPQHAH